MIIASIKRAAGELVVSVEPHPRTGASIIVVAHVAADKTVTCRTPLQPSEIVQVCAALQLAGQTLKGRPRHRTIGADDERGLF